MSATTSRRASSATAASASSSAIVAANWFGYGWFSSGLPHDVTGRAHARRGFHVGLHPSRCAGTPRTHPAGTPKLPLGAPPAPPLIAPPSPCNVLGRTVMAAGTRQGPSSAGRSHRHQSVSVRPAPAASTNTLDDSTRHHADHIAITRDGLRVVTRLVPVRRGESRNSDTIFAEFTRAARFCIAAHTHSENTLGFQAFPAIHLTGRLKNSLFECLRNAARCRRGNRHGLLGFK